MPVTAEIAAIFKAAGRCPAATPYVGFLSTRGHCGQASAEQTFARLRKKLGIDRHVTPHDLRRTMAEAVLDTTSDIRKVQATMGHKNLTTTMYYLQRRLVQVDLDTLETAKRGVR